MSNSPLVSFTEISPNQSGPRAYPITRISVHCVVGQASVEALGALFSDPKVQASSNYGIGADGRVGMYVDESCRSWCTSSWDNDQRAVTIECASDTFAPYAFNDTVYAKLIELVTDICLRNGKTKAIWIDDKERALSYTPADDEMLFTVHRWFANKSCPGDWMMAHMKDLTDRVTKALSEATGGTDEPENPDSEKPHPPVNTPTKDRYEYDITYRSYIAEYGWLDWVGDGEMSGSKGRALAIEAVQIMFGKDKDADVEYRLHVRKNGNTGLVSNGEVAGTQDLARRGEAIFIDGSMPIEYRAYCQKTGWTPWVRNGEWAGTRGEGIRMEAIQIRLAKEK